MKIFWSWQSDHPGNVSRHFVRTALEQAVASLKEELSIDEPEREITLDHDRKGVPGSPDLANIILEKIRRSEVFVADVTPVGATGSEPPKKLMNSNVAIELGYALHTVTDLRTIMVMNAAFGSRADLPFDLQHKAGPTFYRLQSDATKDQIEKARTKLAGELKVALREILSGLAPAAAPFQAAASRPGDPSRYFQVGQTLASRTGPFGNGLHSCKAEETPALYLRIIPTKPTVPLTRAEAIDVLRMGPPHLDPFYYPCGHIPIPFIPAQLFAI